ncbi:MAG: hypothetical protein Q8O43_02665 [Dehalococcoidia bacterium]|nr:hypothetical protein [Dehalococcoidia bacterium]
MEERIIKRLMNSIKCSSCGQNYTGSNVKILGHHHGLYFLNAYCPSCHTQYLLAASVTREKAELVTDLTENELTRFKNSCALTADDVLEMHAFLKKFNGDFTHLFGREYVS